MVDRLPLAHLPTPVEPADRLGRALGMSPGCLWVKRDDCTGLAGGGNKARKLEYLCAEAVARGCDALVTGGGPQSNHVRMTAAAANKLGLGCFVVLGGRPGATPTGNLLLDVVLRAHVRWAAKFDYRQLEAAIEAEARALSAEGRRPYAIPIGGASATGALGYVRAADELASQLPDVELVVVADGSGGTHAGLAAGLGDHDKVLGVDVGARADLDEWVPAMTAEVAALAGRPAPRGICVIDHARVGAGYAATTSECRDAIDLAARTEGLLLDPVYTGKALAGLIAARADGRIGERTRTVFVHTGGLPALFAEEFLEWAAAPPGPRQ